jgi:hypothetical protein
MRYNGLLHDLRRTFITDAENAGAPRHEVSKLGGNNFGDRKKNEQIIPAVN